MIAQENVEENATQEDSNLSLRDLIGGISTFPPRLASLSYLAGTLASVGVVFEHYDFAKPLGLYALATFPLVAYDYYSRQVRDLNLYSRENEAADSDDQQERNS